MIRVKLVPDPDFLPIPDPGVKKAPDLGSGSATLHLNILYSLSFFVVVSVVFRLTGLKYFASDPRYFG
jgi:hypothetical protein